MVCNASLPNFRNWLALCRISFERTIWWALYGRRWPRECGFFQNTCNGWKRISKANRKNIRPKCLKFCWAILLSLPHVWVKVLCSINNRTWLNICLKSGDPRFLVILAIFEANFEALPVIGETRSKQHQIRREKLARDRGDQSDLSATEIQKILKKPRFRANLPGHSDTS